MACMGLPVERAALPEELVRVLLVGSPGVGKRSLVRQFLRAPDLEGPQTGLPRVVTINGQRTLIECEDILGEHDLPSPSGSFLPREHSALGLWLQRRENKHAAAMPKGMVQPLRCRPSAMELSRQREQAERVERNRWLHDELPTSYIVVFDIGSTESFNQAARRLEDLAAGGHPVTLVGNKTDKPRKYREVSYEQGESLAARFSSSEVTFSEMAGANPEEAEATTHRSQEQCDVVGAFCSLMRSIQRHLPFTD
eukprot:TRINITY_DN2448_c0_g1_i3.p1 TRINITY_DN2448_c0_g1~~TRINITY_DN2448_c0_g1_i3.p1  ORF type:complete len:253 (+),score=28.29 TRINITY_DN2448_c0_g1_i3:237-995(+)